MCVHIHNYIIILGDVRQLLLAPVMGMGIPGYGLVLCAGALNVHTCILMYVLYILIRIIL